MMSRRNGRERILGSVLLVALWFVASSASAQFFWTNTTSSIWSDANSWSNGVPSSGGETNYILNFTAPAAYTSVNDFSGGFLLNALRVTTGTVTLTGGDLVFTNNGATAPVLVNSSGDLLSISNNLIANNDLSAYATNDITLHGNLTTLGTFTKIGQGVLTLNGTTLLSSNFNIQAGNIVNINGNLTQTGGVTILGQAAGVSGVSIINQNDGAVVLSGELRIGNVANTTNQYNLYGGSLTVNDTLYIGYSGVRSVNRFVITNGTLTVNATLAIGRANVAARFTTNYFYQSGGTVSIATLNFANSANATGAVGHLIISSGIFTANAWTAFAAHKAQQGYIYLGTGADVTLPAFPTARGEDSYSQITFDGGQLTPRAASANYMTNLTAAYLTTNGAIFNVPVGRDITIAQNLEDAPGHNGKLTKTGDAVLTLIGSNTYSGGTFINGGVLNTLNPFALPNYNAAGAVTVASNAAVSVRIGGAGEWTESQVEDLMTNANFAAGALLGLDTTSGDYTLSRNLDGPAGYAKLGANTLTLTGSNTYTGPTWIYGGTLSVETIGDATTNSGIGWGNLIRFAGGTLQLTGSGDYVTGRNLESLGGATLDITNANASLTLNGNWSVHSATGNLGFTKTGAGKLALNGVVGLNGATVLNDGTTTIGGVVIISNNLTVAGAAGARAFLEIQPGAHLRISTNASLGATYQMYLGNAADAVGVIRQTGGAYFNDRRAEQSISLGAAAGGYGAYELFEGVATGGYVSVGQSGTGYLGVYGGTFVPIMYLFASRAATGTGVVDIAGGALDASSLGNAFVVGNWVQTPNSGMGVMNVRDGGVLLLNKVLLIGRGTNALGIVNLLSGGTASVFGVSASGNFASQAYLNFNGGLLQARPGATTVWMSNELDGAFVFSGGAFLDDNGQALTVAQPLSAPSGKGLSAIAVNNGGSGYLAPPAVIISGGSGVGATAIAQLDYTTGAITNILITSPGSGYQDGDTLTVTLIGGGGTGAVLGAPALTDNVSGSLTKLGTGILTLTGTNTYTGGTVVQAGALVALHTNALPRFDQPGNVTVASNAAIVVRVGGAGEWDTASIDALLNNASLANGAAFGFDTTSGDYTSGHLITGNIGLLKLGANTLTITNANTYTGPTVINAGTLTVTAIADSGTSGIGHGGLLLFQGGALRLTATGGYTTARSLLNLATATMDLVNTNANLTLDGPISGSGGLIKAGPGTLVLTASNSFSGSVGLSNGILNVQHSFALGNSAGVTVGDGSALQIQGDIAIGPIPLTLRGDGFNNTNGALRSLWGNNTYAGNIALAASSTIQSDNGTLTLNGAIARTSGNTALTLFALTNAHIVVTGVIGATGTGQVHKEGTGALTLTGSNSFTAQFNVNCGTVYINTLGGAGTNSSIGTGTQFRLGIGTTSGTLIYTGNGDTTDRQVLIGDNTAGTTRTGAGTIQNDGTGPLIFTNPSFNVTNRNTSTAPLRTLTLSGSNTDDNEIQGIIADNGATTRIALTKTGSGHWILSGQNTYSGATTVNAGTLTVNGALYNSAATVNSGGTLGGTGFVANLTINAGGALSPGNSAGTLTVGNLTLADTPTLIFDLGTVSDLVVVTNQLTWTGLMETNWFILRDAGGLTDGIYTLFESATLSGALGAGTNFTNIAGTGLDGSLFIEGNDVKLVVVPEPGAAALVGTGLCVMVLVCRRRFRGGRGETAAADSL